MLFSSSHSRRNRRTTCCRAASRSRLFWQASGLAVVVLLAGFLSPSRDLSEVSEGFGGELAIEAQTFSLDSLPMTEDGFLIKNSGLTATVDRSELADIVEYTVEAGDNLTSIARAFGISTDTIIWENDLQTASVKTGMVLRILPVSGITHTVSDSDTLAGVAKKYGLKVDQLAKQNQLDEDGELIAGVKIIIPGGRRSVSTSLANSAAYASYMPPAADIVDGAIIAENAAKDKEGKWMIKPTEGIYTSYFGSRAGHWAVDIADASMPPVLAAADGTVVKSQCGWNGGYGCVIVIDHGDGYQTLYAHNSRLDVGVGDAVEQGQQISVMGKTGRVYGKTGIHLHFEVIADGYKKNPLAFY